MKTKTGYMCSTDFAHECGEAAGGVTVYPSLKDIQKNRVCVKECGVTKVEIREVEIVIKTDFSKVGT